MAGPIKPNEVQNVFDLKIPEAIFEIFNDQIVANWDGNKSIVKQDVVVPLVMLAIPLKERVEIFQKRLLDVESAYRKAGWNVMYDKPAFSENYEPFWVFKK